MIRKDILTDLAKFALVSNQQSEEIIIFFEKRSNLKTNEIYEWLIDIIKHTPVSLDMIYNTFRALFELDCLQDIRIDHKTFLFIKRLSRAGVNGYQAGIELRNTLIKLGEKHAATKETKTNETH